MFLSLLLYNQTNSYGPSRWIQTTHGILRDNTAPYSGYPVDDDRTSRCSTYLKRSAYLACWPPLLTRWSQSLIFSSEFVPSLNVKCSVDRSGMNPIERPRSTRFNLMLQIERPSLKKVNVTRSIQTQLGGFGTNMGLVVADAAGSLPPVYMSWPLLNRKYF